MGTDQNSAPQRRPPKDDGEHLPLPSVKSLLVLAWPLKTIRLRLVSARMRPKSSRQKQQRTRGRSTMPAGTRCGRQNTQAWTEAAGKDKGPLRKDRLSYYTAKFPKNLSASNPRSPSPRPLNTWPLGRIWHLRFSLGRRCGSNRARCQLQATSRAEIPLGPDLAPKSIS